MPAFTVVLPVYNEAALIESAVSRMVTELRGLGQPFELLICENGSTDQTGPIANHLRSIHPEITLERLPSANYGVALKHGIAVARHPCVVIYNVDFWNTAFARASLDQLRFADLVIGSKVTDGAVDRRPVVRRLITRSFNVFLRVGFGLRGTDTHGMKALRCDSVGPIAAACVTDGWMFDTELVLRVERQGLCVVEVPVSVGEIRPQGAWSVARRFPSVIVSLARLGRILGRSSTAVVQDATGRSQSSRGSSPHDRR